MNKRPLFDHHKQASTTGELLVEVGRFAGHNLDFRNTGDKNAARQARKHLSRIIKLAMKRSAEIAIEMSIASSKTNKAMQKEQGQEEAA